MKRIADSVVVVAGGTGSTGEGLVRSFLSAGARVVVPYRTEARRERLLQYVAGVGPGVLLCLPASIADPESARRFGRHVTDELGPADLAVACLGGWYYGPALHHMPEQDWHDLVESHLHAHFVFAKTFLPLFYERGTGVYMMINGSPSEMVTPDCGVLSVFAAAQAMMARVIADEAKGTGVRVHSITALNPLKTRERGEQVQPDWLSAEDLGRYVVALYEGGIKGADQTQHRLATVRDLKGTLAAA